jgi:hypothetical protein
MVQADYTIVHAIVLTWSLGKYQKEPPVTSHKGKMQAPSSPQTALKNTTLTILLTHENVVLVGNTWCDGLAMDSNMIDSYPDMNSLIPKL